MNKAELKIKLLETVDKDEPGLAISYANYKKYATDDVTEYALDLGFMLRPQIVDKRMLVWMRGQTKVV